MVERGSVQHGARLDEALAEGSELPLRGGAMTEREDLAPELPGEGETRDVRAAPEPDATNGPDSDALRERSELARWLRPSCFPADAPALVAVARADGAPDDVIAELGLLPTGVHYETLGEVWRALGGEVEVRTGDEDVPPDTELGEAVARAVTEVAAEVADEGASGVEPLTDEAVVEGGVLDEPAPPQPEEEPEILIVEEVVEEILVVEDPVVVEEAELILEDGSSGPSSGSAAPGGAPWSERHEEHSSVVAQVAGLTIAVIDLALVPLRVGVSLVGRVLHRGGAEGSRAS